MHSAVAAPGAEPLAGHPGVAPPPAGTAPAVARPRSAPHRQTEPQSRHTYGGPLVSGNPSAFYQYRAPSVGRGAKGHPSLTSSLRRLPPESRRPRSLPCPGTASRASTRTTISLTRSQPQTTCPDALRATPTTPRQPLSPDLSRQSGVTTVDALTAQTPAPGSASPPTYDLAGNLPWYAARTERPPDTRLPRRLHPSRRATNGVAPIASHSTAWAPPSADKGPPRPIIPPAVT